jgi:Arc/MetJ-type ribon-helix-helix transcriptional regulator
VLFEKTATQHSFNQNNASIYLRLAFLAISYYSDIMKTLTVRLPEQLVIEIETESRGRNCSMSDIVRERLQRPAGTKRGKASSLDAIVDLIGSVDGLPPDLSGQTKRHLKATGYGKKRPR